MTGSTCAALLLAATVTAGSPALAGTVYQLSQSEIDSVVQASSFTPKGDPFADAAPVRDNRIHGEVGTVFGTGGTRAIYGSTIVPLGSDGYAAFSFEDGRYGGSRFRR